MLAIDFSMLAGDLQSSLSTLEANISAAANGLAVDPYLGLEPGK